MKEGETGRRGRGWYLLTNFLLEIFVKRVSGERKREREKELRKGCEKGVE